MQIKIKLPQKGEEVTFEEVAPQTNILALKEQLVPLTGIDAQYIRRILVGTSLRNDRTLEDYNYNANSSPFYAVLDTTAGFNYPLTIKGATYEDKFTYVMYNLITIAGLKTDMVTRFQANVLSIKLGNTILAEDGELAELMYNRSQNEDLVVELDKEPIIEGDVLSTHILKQPPPNWAEQKSMIYIVKKSS